MEIEGKTVVSVIFGALGTVKKGLDQNRQLLPVGHRATEVQTKQHFTQLSSSAGLSRFDLLLRYGLTRRPSSGK